MAAAVGEGEVCVAAGTPAAQGGRGGPGGLPAEPEREGNPAAAPVLPGFDDVDAFVKVRGEGEAGRALCTTAPAGPCAARAVGLPVLMSRVMQYHGCRSHMRDHSKVTELEDKFDMLVDSNDIILERVVSKSFLNITCLKCSGTTSLFG
uniref:Exosome-associated factor Rrp6 N-terminal domain-containing protein n=1 Tax=Pavo cristatus TaxID=9049 RepID=A0A8C9F007_PAVCR